MRESLKPIEPGCLAYVLAYELKGQVVRVIDKIEINNNGACSYCGSVCTHHYWNTETDFEMGECILIRIDPDDEIRKEEMQLDAANEDAYQALRLKRALRKAGVWEE